MLFGLSAGCGGGGSVSITPPPAADFSLSLSTNTVSISQGSSSSGVSVNVGAQNGFSGTVQVALAGLPTGVTSNPASPFTVTPGAGTSLVLTAASNASTGNFSISAQGSSGALSHSTNLALTVQSSPVSNFSRTSYVRTDSTAALDDPYGEPFHRHIIYDAANKHVFVANRTMNRVEVFSSTDQLHMKSIDVPGASSADLSSDGKTILVGTALSEIVAIDAEKLQVSARYDLNGIAAVPGTIFNRPIEVLAMANEKSLVRLRQAISSEALLALWDPNTNALTDLTSTAPRLFQNGVGAIARSGDCAKAIVASNDVSGNVGVFDGNGNLTVPVKSLGNGQIQRVAANADGSRFAITLNTGSSTQLLMLDGSLNLVGQQSASNVVYGTTFSRDGNFLYATESVSGTSFLIILDGHDAHAVGQAADALIQGVPSEIEDADETQLIFGLSNRGLSFVDGANAAVLSAPAPMLASTPAVQPSEGPVAGGTQVSVLGQNFAGTPQVKFGGQVTNNPSLNGSTQIEVNSPANAVSGAVNVSAYFSGGWMALAPDAFSYGPQVLQVLPGAGAKNGGDVVQIYGYGFGNDASKLSVKIGGTTATVQKVESVSAIKSTQGFDASYPFPLERITLQTPSGVPGKVDISISAPSGSAIAAKSFQYLQSVQSYTKPGFYRFLQYDRMRQRVYLSGIDHVDVFDLQAGDFVLRIYPPGGSLPNTGLRGLALTPDGSQLIVADFGTQSVYLLNPQDGTGSTVSVGGVSGFGDSGPARVTATSTQIVFVSMSGDSGSTGACSTCLGQLNLSVLPLVLQPAPQPEIASLTGAPLLQSNATGEQIFVAFGNSPGGPLAVWNANNPNQFTTSSANVSTADLGVAADGTMFALQANSGTEIHRGDLSLLAVPSAAELAQIPGRTNVPGVALHPSGALIYQPFLTGTPGSAGVKGGIDILDAHSGALRLRIFLPQQFMTDIDGLHGSFMATDENGQRFFALTSTDGTSYNASFTVLQLASVPLGIGTITPSTVSATGGAILTIRGSGFQSGTTITIGGKAATTTYKDGNTLNVVVPSLPPGTQQVIAKNPDGETVSWDAAFTAN